MNARLALLVVALSLGVAHVGAPEIVITPTALEPAVRRVAAGERVDFVNRTQRNVHVEFGADPRQHEVVQISASGPITAVRRGRCGPHSASGTGSTQRRRPRSSPTGDVSWADQARPEAPRDDDHRRLRDARAEG